MTPYRHISLSFHLTSVPVGLSDLKKGDMFFGSWPGTGSVFRPIYLFFTRRPSLVGLFASKERVEGRERFMYHSTALKKL